MAYAYIVMHSSCSSLRFSSLFSSSIRSVFFYHSSCPLNDGRQEMIEQPESPEERDGKNMKK
jgi:hypothetical protein